MKKKMIIHTKHAKAHNAYNKTHGIQEATISKCEGSELERRTVLTLKCCTHKTCSSSLTEMGGVLGRWDGEIRWEMVVY